MCKSFVWIILFFDFLVELENINKEELLLIVFGDYGSILRWLVCKKFKGGKKYSKGSMEDIYV